VTKAEWIATAGIAGALLLVLGALRALAMVRRVDSEVLRKGMHVSLGLSALLYPWLFETPLPPMIIAALTLGVLLLLRYAPHARAGLGGVVHGVKRSSEGDLWFPIAVAAVFALAGRQTVLFIIPVLTLTLADAFAALIGARYGQMQYDTLEGDHKSAEGSLAFFLIAFFAAHVPLLVFTSVGRTESLLIGLTFGFLVMLLEAVAWRGLDNLFIPVGGFFLLRSYMPMPARALGVVLGVTIAMFVLVVALRRRRTLSDGAALAGVLLGYMTWTLGGWRWLVPPMVFFVSYTVLWPRMEQIRDRPHRLGAVLAVPGSALLWLACSRIFGEATAYYGYTLTLAANLAFVGVTWYRTVRPNAPRTVSIALSALVAWVALLAPFIVLGGYTVLLRAAVALPVLLAGSTVFAVFTPWREDRDVLNWARQASVGLATAALGALCVMWA
jgi:phytol kinase